MMDDLDGSLKLERKKEKDRERERERERNRKRERERVRLGNGQIRHLQHVLVDIPAQLLAGTRKNL
jgi:hypothetical protein